MSDQDWRLRRKDNRAEITLPQDMRWTDEFDWAKTTQAEPQRTLSGGLVIQQGIKQNGRLVTLAGDWVWLPRATLETLREWADTPELEMVLEHYDGRVFDVVFRLHEGLFADLEPVRFATPETGAERYTATIRLMTV